MTSNIVKTPVITCPVCNKEVLAGPASRLGRILISKPTSCCGIFKTAHLIFAQKFSIKLNNNYKFDSETYVNDTSRSLFCMSYNEICFHCGTNTTSKIRLMFFYVCNVKLDGVML